MIIVIGSFREFELWRRSNGITAREMVRMPVRHLANERDARGLLRPPGALRVVLLPSADMRIIEYLKQRGINPHES